MKLLVTGGAGFIGSPPMNLFDCTLTAEGKQAFLDASEFKLQIDAELAEAAYRLTVQQRLDLRPDIFTGRILRRVDKADLHRPDMGWSKKSP
jgi:ABC-type sugar transport system ATPase subunit